MRSMHKSTAPHGRGSFQVAARSGRSGFQRCFDLVHIVENSEAPSPRNSATSSSYKGAMARRFR